MDFEIHNVARVREAKICLDGVTVIVGPNGSGKSTISRGFMTLRHLMRELPELVVRQKARSLVATFVKSLQEKEPADNKGVPLSIAIRATMVSRSLVQNPEEVCSSEFWNNGEKVYKRFLESQWKNVKKIFLATYKEVAPQVISFLQGQKDEAYTQFVVERALQNGYEKQINTRCENQGRALFEFQEDACSVTASFENENCTSLNITGRVFSETHYLETRHVLDDLEREQSRRDRFRDDERPASRYIAPYDASWLEFLRISRVEDPTLEEAQERAKRVEILERVSTTIHGRLKKSVTGIVFQDDCAVNGEIRIPNIASGMKSMAMIARAIENGWIVQDDVLIIDEPESNLHPEWQVRFAEWLVLLLKHLKIRLLLNTHSPYFMRAIERFTEDAGLKQTLHVYSMEQDTDENGNMLPMFSAKDVSRDIGRVYRYMAKPFDELEFN